MIILDFSKAFDTVPHNRLLNKLYRYAIRNKTHTWISNFLKYRKQRVVIGGEHSTCTEVMSVVPQVTVLGPLLFLTYINDLPNNIHSSIRLFADDCILYREIKNEIDSQQLQKHLNSLMKWEYSRTPLIRPPSETHWCGRIRGMVAREGFVYEQKPQSVTRNVVV